MCGSRAESGRVEAGRAPRCLRCVPRVRPRPRPGPARPGQCPRPRPHACSIAANASASAARGPRLSGTVHGTRQVRAAGTRKRHNIYIYTIVSFFIISSLIADGARGQIILHAPLRWSTRNDPKKIIHIFIYQNVFKIYIVSNFYLSSEIFEFAF